MKNYGIALYVILFIIYIAIYYTLYTFPGVMISDDFGYFRSITESLSSGSLRTYEWLAPYNATFTGLCSAVFTITGNFYVSTYGTLSICALSFYALLYIVLKDPMGARNALIIASIVSFSPPFLHKAADFHSCVLNLVLLLLAILSFKAGRWAVFFIAVFLAVANRQNYITLLFLPFSKIIIDYFRYKKIDFKIISYFIGFGVCTIILIFSINKTYAQEWVLSRFMNNFSINAAAKSFWDGLFVSLSLISLMGFLFRKKELWKLPGRRHWKAPAALTVAVVGMYLFWGPPYIRIDMPVFGMMSQATFNAVLFWFLFPFFISLNFKALSYSPYLVLTVCFIFFPSIRGIWYDYYLFPIALLILIYVVTLNNNARSTKLPRVTLPIVICIALGYGYFFKVANDKYKLAIDTYEALERQGTIQIAEMTDAPFGYLGWKLFDYYIKHDGVEYGLLSDFLSYVKQRQVKIETHVPWRKRFRQKLPKSAIILREGTWSIGFLPLAFRVVHYHKTPAKPIVSGKEININYSNYIPVLYPLTNKEWNKFLESGHTKRNSSSQSEL